MAPSKQKNLPIGYWLKRVDQLLTEHINRAQADNGVSRLEWQTLNALYEAGKPVAAQELPIVGTFIDLPGLAVILSQFIERGWIEAAGSEPVRYALSEAGKRQHGIVLGAQQEVRQQATGGVNEEEYSTVIRVLQQIAENLDEDR